MMTKRFLVGYSGHSYPVIEALKSMELPLDGYFEGGEKFANPYNLIYLGDESLFEFSELHSVFIAIGDNLLRKKVSERLQNKVSFFSIFDDTSVIRSKISQNGVLVNAGAIIQSMCSIGDGVIINTRAIIEHECSIGDYAHIAPGAVLAGNVTIGEYTLIGANATILPGIAIGKNCIIGAGSVVTKNVSDNCVIKGNPAK